MNHVVIFAGGVGSRMGVQSRPKQFLTLEGKEIIVYTIEKFQEHPGIDAIYIACHPDWIDFMKSLVEKYSLAKVVSVVAGGATGQLSIYNGLVEAEKHRQGPDDIVLIHDGVRPVIDEALISGNIACAREKGNAISCAPATETVLLVDGSHEIRQIEDRSSCFHAKAPQTFRLDDIIACHRKAMADGMTSFIDSCSMMDHYGYRLHMVICSSDNIKVTTPKDYYLSKALLKFDSGIVDE